MIEEPAQVTVRLENKAHLKVGKETKTCLNPIAVREHHLLNLYHVCTVLANIINISHLFLTRTLRGCHCYQDLLHGQRILWLTI